MLRRWRTVFPCKPKAVSSRGCGVTRFLGSCCCFGEFRVKEAAESLPTRRDGSHVSSNDEGMSLSPFPPHPRPTSPQVEALFPPARL
jgi:hypothetical protein